MVHASSLVVFTAVALGAVSVVAAPVGGQTTPADAPAQGSLQSVDATIQAQNNVLDKTKVQDGIADERKAMQLEKQAGALNKEALDLDPALGEKDKERARKLKEKKEKERQREREKLTGISGAKPRIGATRKSNGGPKRMDTTTGTGTPPTQKLRRDLTPSAPGGNTQQQRVTTPPPVGAPTGNSNDVSKRPLPGAVGPQGNVRVTQPNQPAQPSFGQQIAQQDKQLDAMRVKYGKQDMGEAERLKAEADALMAQAYKDDPELKKQNQRKHNTNTNARLGSPASKTPTSNNSPAPRLSRRGPGGAPGQPTTPASDPASAMIASQDKKLNTMEVTDAIKDAAEAAQLTEEAQQYTTAADELDPALKKKAKSGGRKKERTGSRKPKNGMENGKSRDRQGTPQPSPPQAPAQQARYDFDEDYYFGRDFDDYEELFGRELFDDEELYGREWYDLEELD